MDNMTKADRIVSEIQAGRKMGLDLFLPIDTYQGRGDETSVYELWVANPCKEVIIITAGFVEPYYGIRLSEELMWNNTEKCYGTNDFFKVLEGVSELLDLFRSR